MIRPIILQNQTQIGNAKQYAYQNVKLNVWLHIRITNITILCKMTKFKIVPSKAKTIPSPEIILTRYLYIKEEVLSSLLFAILDKNCDEALFWGYELYHSGFDEEVFDYLMAMYLQIFRSKNPRLESFLKAQYQEWKEHTDRFWILATIISNFVARQYRINEFAHQSPSIEPTTRDRQFYILAESKNVKHHNTLDTSTDIPARSILKTVCKYATRKYAIDMFECSHKDSPIEDIAKWYLCDWLYYASFSPIWNDRLTQYGGKRDDNNKCVIFDDDTRAEIFYEQYEYESCEQSIEVQRKSIIIDKIRPVQMTWVVFCEKYGEKL